MELANFQLTSLQCKLDLLALRVWVHFLSEHLGFLCVVEGFEVYSMDMLFYYACENPPTFGKVINIWKIAFHTFLVKSYYIF